MKSRYYGESQTIKKKIKGTFQIYDVNIIRQDPSSILYTIKAEHINKFFLSKTINYSNVKDLNESPNNTKISPYKIIKDICNNSSVNMHFDSNYTDTPNFINFISSQSMTCIDIINYCLKAACNTKHAPSFFVYSMLHDSYWLFNLNMSNEKLKKYYLYLNNFHMVVQTDIVKGDSSKSQYLYDLNIIQPVGRDRTL